MVFSSPLFLFLFLPLVLGFYYLPVSSRWRRSWRNTILLLFSLCFYAWGEPYFVFLMLLSIGVNYRIAFFLSPSPSTATPSAPLHLSRKQFLTIAVFWNLSILFIFKYLGFSIGILQFLTGRHLPHTSIALPIGISFFTFQILSYIFDVYYGTAKPQSKFSNLALYIALFPQLIAGPIVRYNTIQNDILSRTESWESFQKGFFHFIVGLTKKSFLANTIAIVADDVFSLNIQTLSCVDAWIGALAYTAQIYFDFSGYSDMAIGLGKMFGFHFEENFHYPYMATSITDFWRRWHISLSTWFRDYVYIPLGGNRCSTKRWILNLSTVWLLTGIWHGANFTFIAWGIWYLFLLLLEKRTHLGTWKGPFMRLYTLLAVIVGWVLFRSESLENARRFLKIMLFPFATQNPLGSVWDNPYLQQGGSIFLLAFIASFPIFPWLSAWASHAKLQSPWARVLLFQGKEIVTILLFLLSILMCIKSTYNPFIYFNF